MLEVKNLHASINGKEILKGINLTVKPGEVHAIMEPNGSGKSTLSSVLVGNPAFEVTEGEVTFNGKNLLELSAEDQQLAKKVDGIDLIISGHTHTTLSEPIQINDTYIVSAGEYCKNLGVLTLTRDGDTLSLADYALIPIDGSLPEDKAVAAKIEDYKKLVEDSYLTKFGGL